MDQAISLFFEQIRNPFLTAVLSFFTFFGEGTFIIGAVAVCYWLFERKTGERILLSAISSLFLNTGLKHLVNRPRPYMNGISKVEIDNFFVSTNDLGDTISFPSGHTQSTANFLTACAVRVKRAWFYVVASLFVLLVMISRVYLGVHYFTDVLAGLLLGVGIALFWQLVYAKWYKARYYILAGFAILSMVFMLFPSFGINHDHVQAVGLICGCAVFLPLTDMVRVKESRFPKRFFRLLVGGVCTGGIFALTLLFPKGEVFTLVKYFLLIGGATLLSEVFFRILKI